MKGGGRGVEGGGWGVGGGVGREGGMLSGENSREVEIKVKSKLRVSKNSRTVKGVEGRDERSWKRGEKRRRGTF